MIYKCSSKGFTSAECATHVAHFDDIRQDAFNLVKGNTHVAHFDKIRQDAFNLVKGNTHVATSDNIRRTAFTLAEVLITLGIIGVVAAMTMPSLIQRHKEKVTVTKVKTALSLLSQTYMLAKADGEGVNDWFPQNSTWTPDEDGNSVQDESGKINQDIFWDKLAPHLKILTRCKASDTSCKKPAELYTLSGDVRNIDLNSYSIINLTNGMTLLGGWISNIDCKEKERCGDFAVDINGIENRPNATGKDIFYFSIQADAISPIFNEEYTMEDYCNIKTSSNRNNGYACTRWIIQNENMDYLHCDDLDWSKSKCD